MYEIVKAEMAITSKLIEHVAQRIKARLTERYSNKSKSVVAVTKLNPPINGIVERVVVII